MFANIAELSIHSVKDNYIKSSCTQSDFEVVIDKLHRPESYVWLFDIVAKQSATNQLELKYIFFYFNKNTLVDLTVKLDNKRPQKSLTHIWKNSLPIEQEIWEFFGVEFSRRYQKQYPFHFSSAPMLKTNKNIDCHVEAWKADKGSIILKPKHHFKYNSVDIAVGLKQNIINGCSLESGTFHIGLEKILEGKNISKTFSVLESYFSTHSIEWSFLLSHAVEDSLDIEVPDRAKAIRMVLLEVSRILNHVEYFQKLSFELGHNALYTQTIIWIKRIQAMFYSFSDNEYCANSIRVGGVQKDISQVWLSRTLKELIWLESSLVKAYQGIIQRDGVKRDFKMQLFSKSMASLWGVTGPVARAVGINFDYRKSNPVYYYSDVSFEVPVGAEGTLYDLVVIRFEEIFQSLKIIVQVLDNLPSGEFIHTEYNRNAQSSLAGSLPLMNEQDFRENIKRSTKIPDLSQSIFWEGSSGVMGLSIDFLDNKIDRLKLHTQSFVLKSIFEKTVKNKDIEEILPYWTILDVDLKEVER